MPKIAIIGAGSIIFSTTLLNDMFATPALKGSTYALMGPTLWKLEKMEGLRRQHHRQEQPGCERVLHDRPA